MCIGFADRGQITGNSQVIRAEVGFWEVSNLVKLAESSLMTD
jgi:hypothetical protein